MGPSQPRAFDVRHSLHGFHLAWTKLDNYNRHLGGVLLEGSDTCSASLQNVVFALTIFPHAQRKAREEIDRVVGRDRAPSWEDLANLPYTLAFIEEVRLPAEPVFPIILL